MMSRRVMLHDLPEWAQTRDRIYHKDQQLFLDLVINFGHPEIAIAWERLELQLHEQHCPRLYIVDPRDWTITYDLLKLKKVSICVGQLHDGDDYVWSSDRPDVIGRY